LPSDSGGLLGPLFAGSRADAELTDRAFLRAMLDAEQALTVAASRAGVVPEAAARAIEAEAGPEAARWVHHGATSQDIMDTALALVAARALGPVLDDLDGAAEAAAGLAETHRATVMAGRTLGQQALPISFGLKAAGWLVALDEAADGLAAVRRDRLAAQLDGAAGTLAAFGPAGVEVAGGYAAELGLAEPTLPWHTSRVRVAELAAALGVAAGVLAKIALDLTLLAQSELAEVSEPADGGPGGSSTLPHKRNPVGAVLITAGTRRVPGLVATLLGSMAQEQERATGAWHAEWEPLAELLRLVGGAGHRTRELLAGLEVHPARMRDNLEATGGLLLAEGVAAGLAGALGRLAAQELVRRLGRQAADSGRSLRAVLDDDPTVRAHLEAAGLDRLLDPEGYLGAAQELIDRALAAHQARVPTTPPARRGSRRPARLAHALSGPEEAPVLVLSNSMGTTMAMWDDQLAPHTGRLRVLRYDHPGHGSSDLLPGPYTMEQLGGDLLGLLDDLGLERVSFCGLSLGGMVGMWLAANAPERVDRLALCCTAGKVDGQVYLERAAKVRAGGTGSVAAEVAERWFTPAFRARAPQAVARAVAMLLATPDEGYAGCCEAIAAMDLRAGLPAITAPTLVIAGGDDPATPPAQAEAIAAAIVGARLELAPGAAHLANIEQPEQITRLLLGHFTRPPAT
jgi:3-oxoadipate enol-lactonase